MPDPTAKIRYESGTPITTGVYACRVNPNDDWILVDELLLWHNYKWCYLGSDQECRYPVEFWAGPLERKHLPRPAG